MTLETLLREGAADVNEFEAGQAVPEFHAIPGQGSPKKRLFIAGVAAAAAAVVIGVVVFNAWPTQSDDSTLAVAGEEAAEGFRPMAPGATWTYDVTLNGVAESMVVIRIDEVRIQDDMNIAMTSALLLSPEGDRELDVDLGVSRTVVFADGSSTLDVAPWIGATGCDPAEPLVLPPLADANPGEPIVADLSVSCDDGIQEISVEGEVVGPEQVVTPAGMFDAVRVDLSVSGDVTAAASFFFSDGTGLVVVEVDGAQGLRRLELADLDGFDTNDQQNGTEDQ